MFASLIAQLVVSMCMLYPAPKDPETSDKGFGFLGVAYENEVEGKSIRIIEVYSDTPAKRGGLLVDDVILALNGNAVTNIDLFTKTIVRTRPGTVVELEIERNKKNMKVKVKLGLRPETYPYNIMEPMDLPK